MIPLIILGFAVCLLIAELWTGMVFVGWAGDNMVVQREKSPVPYWSVIAIHMVFGVGLPVLLLLAK